MIIAVTQSRFPPPSHSIEFQTYVCNSTYFRRRRIGSPDPLRSARRALSPRCSTVRPLVLPCHPAPACAPELPGPGAFGPAWVHFVITSHSGSIHPAPPPPTQRPPSLPPSHHVTHRNSDPDQDGHDEHDVPVIIEPAQDFPPRRAQNRARHHQRRIPHRRA